MSNRHNNIEIPSHDVTDTISPTPSKNYEILKQEVEYQQASKELTEALGGNQDLTDYFNNTVLPKIIPTQQTVSELLTNSNTKNLAKATKEIAKTAHTLEKDLSHEFPNITEEQKSILLTLSSNILGHAELTEKLAKKSTLDKINFFLEILPGIGSAVNFLNAIRGKNISGEKVSRVTEATFGFVFLGVDIASLLAAIPSGGTSIGGAAAARGGAVVTKAALKSGAKTAAKEGSEIAAKRIIGKKVPTQVGSKLAARKTDPTQIKSGLEVLAKYVESGGKYTKLSANLTKGAGFMEKYPRLTKTANWGIHKARQSHIEKGLSNMEEDAKTGKKAKGIIA